MATSSSKDRPPEGEDLAYPASLLSHLGIRVAELVPILGKGSINDVYRVRKSDGHTVVLRLNRDRSMNDALYEYHREGWCMRTAEGAGIHTSKSLGYGTWDGRAWNLQVFIPGPTADEVPEANESTWRFLGECLRRLEAYPADAYGPEAREVWGETGPRRHWENQFRYNLDCLSPDDALLRLGVYPMARQAEIREMFAKLADLPLRFGLAHGDFSLRNVILSPTGPVLIDWGCATEHLLPVYEIVETLRNAVDGDPDEAGFRAFEEGYGGFSALLPYVRALRLLRAFDLVRWTLDQRPEQTGQYAEAARKTVEATI